MFAFELLGSEVILTLVVCFTVYWIAGAQTCFLLTSASFIVPLVLLSTARRLKEEWATRRQDRLQTAPLMFFYSTRETLIAETIWCFFLLLRWMLWCLQLLGEQALNYDFITNRNNEKMCVFFTLCTEDHLMKQDKEGKDPRAKKWRFVGGIMSFMCTFRRMNTMVRMG